MSSAILFSFLRRIKRRYKKFTSRNFTYTKSLSTNYHAHCHFYKRYAEFCIILATALPFSPLLALKPPSGRKWPFFDHTHAHMTDNKMSAPIEEQPRAAEIE